MLSKNQSPAIEKDRTFGNTVINVPLRERIVSVLAGGVFLGRGLKQLSLVQTLLGGYLVYRGASGHCFVYSQKQRSKYTSRPESVNIQTRMIVNRPRAEVYDFWRKLENLPLFMKHLHSVREVDEKRSHWEANVPGNVTTVKWDAEIVKEEEGSLISWRSLPGATIENAGKVDFSDALGHMGTELHVVITYRPPAGKVGSSIAWLLTPVFKKMIENDISNFKQFIETGILPEVAS
ncbi:MAG TPA: SRPBCC family protein [Chitinophagaceae bacterium]|jgi:uncharacterized membrane protein|nr:SRPBCC family protein [Chitinophagaceae bacterium]